MNAAGHIPFSIATIRTLAPGNAGRTIIKETCRVDAANAFEALKIFIEINRNALNYNPPMKFALSITPRPPDFPQLDKPINPQIK